MRRDHLFGYPAALTAVEPAPTAPRYPLGRPTRDPEPQTWPFPLVKPAVTFVADSRTMDSDRPQPVVLGVDMGKPGGDETLIALRSGSVLNLYDATSWVSVSGGFTWDASSGALIAKPSEPEKPAQGEPQFKVGDTVHYTNYGSLARTDYTGEVIDNKPNERGLIGVRWKLPSGKISEQRQPPSCLVLAKAKAEPQPDSDGWIAHKPGPRPAHLKAGMKVELKWNSAIKDTNVCVLQDPFGSGWEYGIVAYRVVSA